MLTAGGSLSAQEFMRRGINLGADRDTNLYIIASPFDNWYLYVGGGVQTFIGNEQEAVARRNKLDFSLQVELGKWIIPDLSVSLRLSAFTVHGQSRYGKQPFIDFTNVPYSENGVYEYQPFSAYAFALMGFVTLDWTNFIKGYDVGKRTKIHWFTPIGLGASMLTGRQVNPNSDYEIGSIRRNFELAYEFAIGMEYIFSKTFAFNTVVSLFGSESTWDWSPYNNSFSRFDLMPSIKVNARFNFLHRVKKYNHVSKNSEWVEVNHEFLYFGTRQTIPTLQGEIIRLNHEKDEIQNSAYIEKEKAQRLADSIDNEIRRAENEIDSLRQNQNQNNYRSYPLSLFEELLDINEVLNLPATIVYFQLDKYDLDYNAIKRLEDFCKEVRSLGDTLEYYIIGAADSATGTVRRNQYLSEHRCEVVNDKLSDECGMTNQLHMIPLGGISKYDPKENNRIALVIQRTPETKRIVERWLKEHNK